MPALRPGSTFPDDTGRAPGPKTPGGGDDARPDEEPTCPHAIPTRPRDAPPAAAPRRATPPRTGISPVPPADPLEAARDLVAGARHALVLTGAGVSADSGMPTFRGEDGLWKEHRPEELATPRAFRRDPRLVWEWYAWRRSEARGCEPNEGHLALARWTVRRPGVWLATQNVDGLHGEALRRVRDGGAVPGSPAAEGVDDGAASGGDAGDARDAGDAPSAADRLLELHGSLFRVRCTGCGHREERRAPVETGSREALPRCPECGGLLRPDVVWFGEPLDRRILDAAREAGEAADVCLSVGTSAAVEPAASLARIAAASGAGLVEVNPEETPLSPLASVAVRGGAADALPRLLDPGT